MSKQSTKKRQTKGVSAKPSQPGAIDSWADTKLTRLNKTQTAQVFISSLNSYPLRLSPDDKSILSDFRKYLARQIENNFRFLSADINEEWTAAGAGNPRETTRYLSRTCHVFIGILVDSYGFTDHSGLSATQIEFEAAYEDSPEKMLIFIQAKLRKTDSEEYKKLPAAYRKLLEDLQAYSRGKVVNFFRPGKNCPVWF